MGSFFVELRLGKEYRHVWCEADSYEEAEALAQRQNRKLSEQNHTPPYHVVKVERLDKKLERPRLFRRR